MKGKIMKASTFAAVKHEGQVDDEGLNYYMTHLVPVRNAVEQLTEDEDIICAAVLHDILEDTDTTYEKLVKEFGQRVADLVNECTDEGEADSYGKYFPRLKTKEGILIKLVDRASNISRMNSWPKGRQEQYLKKTKFWKDGHDL